MANSQDAQTIIIGAGIVGLATAKALIDRGESAPVLLEAESQIATHQTGHNSGVIHSGLYYKPGSLKATLCTTGRDAMYQFCRDHDITVETSGKVVVATQEHERPQLESLRKRGTANGIADLEILNQDQLRKHEPHITAIAGMFVREAGITDFGQVAQAMRQEIEDAGGTIQTGVTATRCHNQGEQTVVETNSGPLKARHVVNCAGLHCDRIARASGLAGDVRIVPFRGEYTLLSEQAAALVRSLIYPVPDPRFPFLGVHLTRTVHGTVKAGPNALLAFARHGYKMRHINVKDLLGIASYSGSWRMAAKYWRTGVSEFRRSLSKRVMLRSIQQLIPEIQANDLKQGPAGVRAQAVDRSGQLLDDFCIKRDGNIVHVLNAPSPAATASITIGQSIAAQLLNTNSSQPKTHSQ